jgi:DNA-binding transcriptional ArsR family regulator
LLYKRHRLTVAEIAETQRVTVGTVVSYLPETTARDRRRHDVFVLRRRGLVPYAICDALELSDETVSRYLRELEDAGAIDRVPSYVSR